MLDARIVGLECWGGQTWQRAAAGEHNAWAAPQLRRKAGWVWAWPSCASKTGHPASTYSRPDLRPTITPTTSVLQPRPCPTD